MDYETERDAVRNRRSKFVVLKDTQLGPSTDENDAGSTEPHIIKSVAADTYVPEGTKCADDTPQRSDGMA